MRDTSSCQANGKFGHRPRRRWRAVFGRLAVTGALAVAGVAAVPTAASATTPPFASCTDLAHATSHGITCQAVSSSTVSSGTLQFTQVDITMTSTAVFVPRGGTPSISPVQEPIHVRVLLPNGYDPTRATGYQSLYLLHGGAATYTAWTDGGQLVTKLANMGTNQPYNGIFVMPDGGEAGWYSDWQGHTDGNFAPEWETFHIDQLIPWVDANFHTVNARSGRAIAGYSMGGLGALNYAAHHPDLFSAVGAFSPGIDISSGSAQNDLSMSGFGVGASLNDNETYNPTVGGPYRINRYTNGMLDLDQYDQLVYRLDAMFGSHVDTGRTATLYGTSHPVLDWPGENPQDELSAGDFAAYSGKLGLYVGACTNVAADATTGQSTPTGCGYAARYSDQLDTGVNEGWLATYTAYFDSTATGLGISHRACYGAKDHNWDGWGPDFTDWLRYVYGTTPSACPNA